MAVPFFLYGSSPDALAAQQQNYERLFTNAAEGNRAAAQSVNATSLQAYLQAQAADDAAREFDARNRIAQMEEARRQNVADRIEAEGKRRFDIETGLRRQDIGRQNYFDKNVTIPRARAELTLLNQRVSDAKENNPIALKQLEFAHSRAAEDADVGMINSPEEAVKLYPGLTPLEAKSYFDKSNAVRAQLEARNNALERAAKTLTDYEQARRNAIQYPTDPKYGMIETSLKPNADVLFKSGVVQQLDFNPESGTYTAMAPKLPWQKATTGTGNSQGGKKILEYFAKKLGVDGIYKPVLILTQQQYDALPSGSYYVDSNGNLGKKK